MLNLSKIVDRLKTLIDIEKVSVEASDENKTIYIRYPTQQSLDFKFTWQDNHSIGYFLDKDGQLSHAVISLWKPIDAIYFVTAYSLLIELRAGRLSPLA